MKNILLAVIFIQCLGSISLANPKVMELAVGETEDAIKKVSWFKTCKRDKQNKEETALQVAYYDCVKPGPVTDEVTIAIFKGKIFVLDIKFSQDNAPKTARVPSIDAAEVVSARFGKPDIELSDISRTAPSKHVMEVCAARGGCAVRQWTPTNGKYLASLYTSEVGMKPGAIQLKYFDIPARDQYNSEKEIWQKKDSVEKGKAIGI